ncbi:DUF4365 domain-containing protein [Pseudomonas sp. MAFF 311095]|uniref:DUF4365 domain-containing protein n=1 Tax=Pseudomonas petroselini TaxID=2899822 RepID=A0ABS8QZ26_9PSED|nr:DUF4365 domain-containing protein [Pseudomonas petroselini]MCD7040989.1 DUF4365 domain-containing protein [Pseudomonas petroselini]MCD7043133.1 DUF4365 domain-containing protein [Pseudomonas petroselini]MCD7070360.1 DUF4365 domain-containing protein [Pseudomonas petroselini]MCD7077736.1 DUF4365 domain-containing protein [Pseudomonas petroselini]
MEENQKKAQFSVAYVKAIAAQIGFTTSIPDVDEDSVDIILKARNFSSLIRNPQLEIQLKCTADGGVDPTYLKFPLSIKNYNDLRGMDLVCPRYVFVLVVPESCGEWLTHDVDHAKIKHYCYWMSLSTSPAVLNSTSVTINIPKTQLLTAESMKSLMQSATVWGVN